MIIIYKIGRASNFLVWVWGVTLPTQSAVDFPLSRLQNYQNCLLLWHILSRYVLVYSLAISHERLGLIENLEASARSLPRCLKW